MPRFPRRLCSVRRKSPESASSHPDHRDLKSEQNVPMETGQYLSGLRSHTTRKGLLCPPPLYLLLFNFFIRILRPRSRRLEGRGWRGPTRLRPQTKRPSPGAADAGRAGSAQADPATGSFFISSRNCNLFLHYRGNPQPGCSLCPRLIPNLLAPGLELQEDDV